MFLQQIISQYVSKYQYLTTKTHGTEFKDEKYVDSIAEQATQWTLQRLLLKV